MAKKRLRLKDAFYSYGKLLSKEIICRKIQIVTIDGINFYKKDFYGNPMPGYYRLILNNIKKISYIKYGDLKERKLIKYTELYLRNGKYHCLNGPAEQIISENDNAKFYYIDGLHIRKEKWKVHPERIQLLREKKLFKYLHLNKAKLINRCMLRDLTLKKNYLDL